MKGFATNKATNSKRIIESVRTPPVRGTRGKTTSQRDVVAWKWDGYSQRGLFPHRKIQTVLPTGREELPIQLIIRYGFIQSGSSLLRNEIIEH